MISDKINTSLTNIDFNINKSLERLAENQMQKGVSSQQYTITGVNELAVMLSDALGNMQNQMGMGSGKGKGKGKGQGQGEGQGFQLSDIIKKQESLNEKMKEGSDKGKKEGEKGKDGSSGKGEQGEGEGNGEGENGEGGKNGKNGTKDGKGEGEGEGNNEDMNGELYEIFKQQQMLRQQLQDKLSKEGLNGKGGDLLREMEGVEQQLLDKGFNERTLERMLNLKYELLKLDEANFKQGQDSKRESQTNKTQFQNTKRVSIEDIIKYFNTTEILNREALPLQQEYKQKVQDYFKKSND
jgi:hypothetical protein